MDNLKRKAEYILKHNLIIQYLYKFCMSAFFKLMGLFIHVDEKTVLFSSFGGKKFNDSPRVLFESIKNDTRFYDYKLVWAFENPELFNVEGAEKVKIDSLKYFCTALRAKVWITSVNIERGLKFKNKKTIYINTWHGAGTKKIGNACSGRKDYDFSNVDMMLVQSEFEREIFLRDFNCNPNAIRMIGFPRNDELFSIDSDKRERLKEQFNIPKDKKVILYAPTWRDSKNGGISYDFVPPIDMKKWEEKLADKFVMLFRMHTLTTEFDMKYDEFARDVSNYDNLNHILAISDIIITDYSTIVYDCAVAKKPFICFGFDYDTYKEKRGFYFDLNAEYPGGVLTNEDDVINRVLELSNNKNMSQFEAFREKYIQAGGNSTNTVIEELGQLLKI